MTLCQTPCIAWDQESLKTLAASKKCKVITLKNDINVDSKTTINVAAGTIIDGNGHTLNMSKTSGDVIQLQATSSLRNMNIRRKYNDTADTQFIHSYAADAVLENVTLIDENENPDNQKYKKLIAGTLINSTFKGKVDNLNYAATFAVITLKEGSRFEIETKDAPGVTFALNGTSDKPVSLALNTSYTGIQVDVQNLAATVILRGVTYKPKNKTMTTSGNIPTSPDWEKVSQ